MEIGFTSGAIARPGLAHRAGRHHMEGLVISSLGARASGLRLERIQASPRFIAGAFRNTARVAPGLKQGTAMPTVGEFLFGGARRKPPGPLPAVDPRGAWLA